MSCPAIPDRWIAYKALGRVIEGTRFICFKVPLKRSVQVGKPQIKEIWDVKTLLHKVPNLGAVIDLTNTCRYYDPKELRAAGVLHKKIKMQGRVIPPRKKVQEFMETVDEFLENNCDCLVGVHCTHGLNRTGYMVCRYLRDRLCMSPKEAIKKFEKARGYKIEREVYIADLLGLDPPPQNTAKNRPFEPLEEEETSDRLPNQEKEDMDSQKLKRDQKPKHSDKYKSKRSSKTKERRLDDDRPNYNWRIERRNSDASEHSFDYRYDY